ncbi:hypothetical protein [Frankia sp. R82]|uniref:hypothetical protein n=1 Tax=Frankia sp. R82 TaxID=2950553 RepID=UPI002042C5A0|nr:hypothetical protein [Frankia sp. R82]MCM3884175.1 hypothetical protein [Frankia sp. R82]
MADPPAVRTFIPGEIETDGFLNAGLGTPLNFLMQKPLCVVTNSGNVLFNANQQAGMLWNTDVYDPYNFHDQVNNTYIIKPTYSGYFTVTTWFAWAGANSGYRQIRITKNANGNYLTATNYGGMDVPNIGGPGQGMTATSIPVACNGSSDYLEVVGYQTSTGQLNALAGNFAAVYFHSK